ncbi:MAG: NlpBDapX lipoprotein [Betaproteobacteria bacterium RBG_16_56_24]|nr:MAG: NlpBDapX lipoprotein [Betaproteobacteria bacterium RBG_16_56_24]
MKVLQIGISGAVLVILASCSTLGADGKRIDYGSGVKQAQALDVPPDLTVPGIDDRYKIPQGDSGTVATYSDYSKGGNAQGQAAGRVLPDVKGVRMERDGTRHWLVVSDKTENVWSVVKAFWLEIGLVIKSEDQPAGVMETDWAENRAKIPQGAVRSVLGKVLDRVYSTGERDQYLTRLERGDEKLLSGHPKDGKSTEVHITHRGIAQVFSSDMTGSRWVPRGNDPEMEAIMLQRLMVRFGASETQAASAVAAISPAAAASGVATISTTEPAGTASLREISDGSVVMVMNDPFDRSWRKVGLAIEGSGLAIEDRDRDKGIYFLRPVKLERSWWDRMKFWKADPAKKHYRVNVKDGGSACEVSVTDQDGANSSVTKQMIETLYKNINK